MCQSRRSWSLSLVSALLSPLAALSCGDVPSPLSATAHVKAVPALSKVMVVVFENEDLQVAINQPNFKRMAQQGASFSNFLAETHPSQGNYIAMTAGDLYGVRSDANVNIDARNIVDLLERAGKSWKIYAEDLPSNCFLGATNGNYARKHVPFISFINIQSNPSRCAHIVSATQLQRDITSGQIPDYSFYVPNMKNDGHDTGVAYADRWLGQTFSPLLSSSQLAGSLTLFLTFDESSLTGGNKIYTIVWGNKVRAGATSSVRYDHYSMLKTIEIGLGLGDLGKKDASATLIDDVWQP